MSLAPTEALWTHLHWLTVLEEQRSYTRSAERLGVSKAAVSQKISELERATGVQLVRRTTRSVQLTPAGVLLAASARQPFTQLAQGLAAVQEHAAEPHGRIRVTAPVAFSRQHLAPVLVAFGRKFPQVRVELDLSDSLRSLATEGFDLAIRHTQDAPETHVAWRLAPARAMLVASPGYLRRHSSPSVPMDLTGHSCLLYPRRQATTTWSFVKASQRKVVRAEIFTVPVTGPLAINNSEMLRDAAVAGMGVALLPDFSGQSALQAGKLVELLPDYRSVGAFGDWLYAIRPYGPHVPAAVRAFVAELREHFAGGFE